MLSKARLGWARWALDLLRHTRQEVLLSTLTPASGSAGHAGFPAVLKT